MFRAATPALAAIVVTGAVVSVALAASGSSTSVEKAVPEAAHVTVHPSEMADRGQESASRSARRVTLKAAPPKVKGHQFMTAPLNVWPGPRETKKPLNVLPAGTRVPVTGLVRGHWAQIVREGKARWVNNDYLSDTKPTPSTGLITAGGVLSSAACASGSSMESGIVSSAIALHRAVCAHFPQVTTYGGYRPDGEHADGHAIDIMIPDSSVGQAIADWVRANASILHVDDVIWSQHIWTTQRSSEGWRGMPDRGSTTANHYDHVHVRVF